MNPLEIAGFLTGIAGVYLTARQNIWCWPVGILNVGIYALVFWQTKLYADMGLQVIYVAFCCYGWWQWLHGGKGGGRLEVARAPGHILFLLLLAGAVATAGGGLLLRRHTDAALPFWDAGTAAYSLASQWLQTRKWIETWWLWIVVDVVYVGMYVNKALYWTALLYMVFLALCVLGLREWRKALVSGC